MPNAQLDPFQDSDYISDSDEEFDLVPDGKDDDEDKNDEDEDDEDEDDDYNHDGNVDHDDASVSSSDTEDAKHQSSKRKYNPNNDSSELDSGDEATITIAHIGRKKPRRMWEDDMDEHVVSLSDDEGNTGGLIKTRAQRRLETKEKKPLADVKSATADVNAIWATLITTPVGRATEETTTKDSSAKQTLERLDNRTRDACAEEQLEEEMITIKRTYAFAGDRVTEERQVPKSSAEAKLYLGQQQQQQQQENPGKAASGAPIPNGAASAVDEDRNPLKKPPAKRKPLCRRSRFDPNPTAHVKGLPPEKQLTWARRRALLNPNATTPSFAAIDSTKASIHDTYPPSVAATAPIKIRGQVQKLNTVDKSRLDWAGYVDKEGIADELGEYGRAKEGYLGRMDFLNRVDQRREEERRTARAALRG